VLLDALYRKLGIYDIIDGQKWPADYWMRTTGFETIRTRQCLISYKEL